MKKTLLFAAVFMMMQFPLMAQQGGYALLFDGSDANEYVNCGNSASLQISGTAITMEAWIYPKSFATNFWQNSIIEKTYATGWPYCYGYVLRCGGSGILDVAFGNSTHGWFALSSDANALVTNKWQHVAAAYDGENIKLYVNGKLVKSVAETKSISATSSSFLAIGNNQYDSDRRPFDGYLDEIRIWNAARTEAEIKTNMFKEIGTHTNLKAYYKMSDGTGTSLTDNSGNSNTGTLTNSPVWKASGSFAGSRQALDFDGTNDYINCGYMLNPSGETAFTVEAWVNLSDTTKYHHLIWQYMTVASPDPDALGWLYFNPNSGKFRTQLGSNPGKASNHSVIPGEWTHLAVVWTGTTLNFYLNGLLDITYSGINTLLSSTRNLYIGWGGYYTNTYFQGDLDEVRIWTIARTESEIRECMFKTLAGNETGLKAYYRFDQYDGSTLFDMTANGYNGTLTNMDPATDWVVSTAFNTWLGGESTDWSTAGNWSNGVPASAQSAGIFNWSGSLPNVTTYLPVLPTTVSVNNLLIPSGVSTVGNVNLTATGSVFMGSSMTLSSDALNTAGNLVIESGKVLTLPATSQLTVSGATTNSAGNSGLVIQSGSSGTGSLIHNSSGVAATVQTYITGSSTITNKKYHFVSIPTQYASPTSNLFLGSYLYKLDPTQTFADNNYGKWVSLGTSTTTELQTNQGYMIYYPNTSNTYTFEGNLNNGTYAYSLTGHSGSGVYTFNLVPNPYPSSLVWNTGDATKWTKSAGVGGSCYIWNAGNGNYSTVSSSATSYIPVGQAFMVLVTNEAAPTLSVLNASRTHSSQAFYKSGNGDENQLVVEAFSNNYADKTTVKFSSEATEAFDLQTDGLKLTGLEEAPQLYTLSGNEKYSINNLPVFEGQKIVPMNFETQFTGEVTLNFSGIESFETSLNIYLQDLISNQTINLRNQQVYTFSHNHANPVNRFNLVFGGTIGIEESISKPAVMWIAGNTLYINTPEKAGQSALLEVFDVSGKILTSRTVTLSELTTLELKQQGLIIVKLTTGDEVLTTKGILMK